MTIKLHDIISHHYTVVLPQKCS